MSLLELLAAKKKALNAGNRKKTAKLPDGNSRWRILPSWRKDSEQFWHDFGQHFVKGADGTTQAVYLCVDKTFNRPCALCDTIKAGIKAAPTDAIQKQLKDALGGQRILVNAVQFDPANPASVNEVVILELPPTVFGQIVDIAQEHIENAQDPFHPVSGKDFIIGRTGAGLNTKYTVQVGVKTTPVSADVLNKLNNLDEYVAQESSEAEMRALNAVRAATGLLPAPSAAPTRAGVGAAGGLLLEDESAGEAPWMEEAAAPAPAPAAAPKAAPKPSPAPAPAPVAAGSGDDDLDALLAKLG